MVSAMDAHRRDALEDACSAFCSHTSTHSQKRNKEHRKTDRNEFNERKRQKDAKRERGGLPRRKIRKLATAKKTMSFRGKS